MNKIIAEQSKDLLAYVTKEASKRNCIMRKGSENKYADF